MLHFRLAHVFWLVLGLVLASGCAKAPQARNVASPTVGELAPPARTSRIHESAQSQDSVVAWGDEEVAPRGLGTEYGEPVQSWVTHVPFERDADVPEVVLSLHYNDTAGVRELARYVGDHRSARAKVSSEPGSLVVAIVDARGRMLDATDVDGTRYAIGENGQRYRISIENRGPIRYEVVASVDGLDVLTGDEAEFSRRGYIIEPYSSMMLDGWRTSEATVAAFRFGTVADSYAARRDMSRNIGVIGVAFFPEYGATNFSELERRHSSRPFGQGYAPPPPPR